MASGYKYFLYSTMQLRERTSIDKRIGKQFKPGSVAVGSKMRNFTEMSTEPGNRYPDTVIVAEGDVSNMRYTPISSVDII